MIFGALAAILPALIPLANAGQIPVVDGVIGGVPATFNLTEKADSVLAPAATTPGQLRIVENHGVCGKLIHSTLNCREMMIFSSSPRNDPGSVSSFWLRRLDIYQEYMVRCFLVVLSFKTNHNGPRFWYFAARNNPDTAPLALWFNGGVCISTPLSVTSAD